KPSRTITQQVLREGVALLSNDLFASDSLGARASLAEANVCSVLCVPMIVLKETLGVIYLDTSDTSARFDEDDLQLLTAIAGIAAMAFANARQVASLESENQRLRNELNITHQLVGQSEALNRVLKFIAKVAPADSTVLIRGESGTGKELAARAIHVNSRRATKPFVAINCATLTETLIESELFGHEKGAFTGAIAQKRGKLEVAEGGTLFLDEIAELSPLMQAKLLRVLQEREFERVGGTRPIKIDVRIITATNQDLNSAIESGKFRSDLYYRLNVVSIVMPALCDRREDISLLASYFVSVYSKKCKRKVGGISEEARHALQEYDWPGNVRELENAIERAVVLGSSDLIGVDDLPERLVESATPTATAKQYHQGIAEAKKLLIVNALRETKGNYTEAAKTLGIHPNNLHRLIKTLNLKSEIANS
ncbi:MAG TPA: sigma 54-interacting transcriptional regulator, partial [Pyrinomonadaceae bacterium]|nr:sigma 54-interacting transcriptional regulator [Pyrinomonadaceae bacterium]